MRRILGLGIGSLQRAGKQDHYARAPSRFAFEVDEPLICSDDAAHSGQSQASPFAGILGGKKGLEQALAGLRAHSVAVVSHREQNAWKRRKCLLLHGPRYWLEPAIAGLDGNAAAIGQGVARVQHQIQENLLSLRLIDLDCSQAGIEMQIQLNVFPDQPRQQLAHGQGNLVQV
jgi:hypothetical protein